MTVCGIIAEFNPFHNGHAYFLKKARELTGADTVIVVMSGNFTQRGEPAVIDKWRRSETAVRNGADIVIELPYIDCVQAATHFASAGVRLLSLARCDWIAFGSECGNLENLQEIADTPANPDHLHEAMSGGMSYPRAYSLLTGSMLPNDLLAVCYLRALRNTNIHPVLIQRTNQYLDQEIAEISSAYAIRNALENGMSIHGSTPMEQQLVKGPLVFMKDYWPYLRTLLSVSPSNRLSPLFLCSEGIEYMMQENARRYSDFSDFIDACTSYRYTASRIRRTCLSIMNQITSAEVSALPQLDTLRILAFNDQGRRWLHDMRKKDVKIAARFAMIPRPYREMEYRTSLLYASALNQKDAGQLMSEEIRGAHYVR